LVINIRSIHDARSEKHQADLQILSASAAMLCYTYTSYVVLYVSILYQNVIVSYLDMYLRRTGFDYRLEHGLHRLRFFIQFLGEYSEIRVVLRLHHDKFLPKPLPFLFH